MTTIIFKVTVGGANFVPTRESWNKIIEETRKFSVVFNESEEHGTQVRTEFFMSKETMHIYARSPSGNQNWVLRFFPKQGFYCLKIHEDQFLKDVLTVFKKSKFFPEGAEIDALKIHAFSSTFNLYTCTYEPGMKSAYPLLEWYLKYIEGKWSTIGRWLLELICSTCGQEEEYSNNNLVVANMLISALYRLPIGELNSNLMEVERLMSLKTFEHIYAQLSDRMNDKLGLPSQLRSSLTKSTLIPEMHYRIEIRQLAVIWSQIAYLKLSK